MVVLMDEYNAGEMNMIFRLQNQFRHIIIPSQRFSGMG